MSRPQEYRPGTRTPMTPRQFVEALRELWKGDTISRGVVLWALFVLFLVGAGMGALVIAFMFAVLA